MEETPEDTINRLKRQMTDVATDMVVNMQRAVHAPRMRDLSATIAIAVERRDSCAALAAQDEMLQILALPVFDDVRWAKARWVMTEMRIRTASML